MPLLLSESTPHTAPYPPRSSNAHGFGSLRDRAAQTTGHVGLSTARTRKGQSASLTGAVEDDDSLNTSSGVAVPGQTTNHAEYNLAGRGGESELGANHTLETLSRALSDCDALAIVGRNAPKAPQVLVVMPENTGPGREGFDDRVKNGSRSIQDRGYIVCGAMLGTYPPGHFFCRRKLQDQGHVPTKKEFCSTPYALPGVANSKGVQQCVTVHAGTRDRNVGVEELFCNTVVTYGLLSQWAAARTTHDTFGQNAPGRKAWAVGDGREAWIAELVKQGVPKTQCVDLADAIEGTRAPGNVTGGAAVLPASPAGRGHAARAVLHLLAQADNRAAPITLAGSNGFLDVSIVLLIDGVRIPVRQDTITTPSSAAPSPSVLYSSM